MLALSQIILFFSLLFKEESAGFSSVQCFHFKALVLVF